MSLFAHSIALADSFGTGSNEFSVDFVVIGNPGNPADRRLRGSVSEVFSIGRNEISRVMVEKANSEGGLGITLSDMSEFGIIVRPNMPAAGISWNEAARFANWLNTSRGYHPAYQFSFQPGDEQYSANQSMLAWTTSDPGYDIANRFRNRLAKYFLPTLDEWYKAAYFDPSLNGGLGGYWEFPTGGNVEPIPVLGGTEPMTAVYGNTAPADVGNAGGLSPYGVMALGGNVDEWVQKRQFGTTQNGCEVGGAFFSSAQFLSRTDSSVDCEYPPYAENGRDGFRVASVPEPMPTPLLFSAALLVATRSRARLVDRMVPA